MYFPKTFIVTDFQFNGECLFALLSTFKSIDLLGRTDIQLAGFIPKSVDVVVLDVNEQSNISEIKDILKQFKNSRVLIVTASSNTWFLSSLLHQGANGVFVTTEATIKLCEAIHEIYVNKWYLPANLYNKLYCELDVTYDLNSLENVKSDCDIQDKIDVDSLTSREVEVLRHMIQGEPSNQIANELFISKSTVFTHRKHILKKLGFSNTPTLIRVVMEQGFI